MGLKDSPVSLSSFNCLSFLFSIKQLQLFMSLQEGDAASTPPPEMSKLIAQ